MSFDEEMNALFQKQREGKRLFKDYINPKNQYGDKCMFQDCNETCIQSHSISRRFLELISEENNVICPIIDPCNIGRNIQELENSTKPNIKFEKLNILTASKFRGFCKEHDNKLFEHLDNYGIENQRDILLQLYRTTCKYIFTNEKVIQSEMETYGYQYWANSEFEEKISLSLSKIKNSLAALLLNCPNLDTTFNIDLNSTLIIDPSSYSLNSEIKILYKKLPNNFNMALEKDLIIPIDNQISHCVVVVFPEKKHSNLMVISSPQVINMIFTQKNIGSSIAILNMIESILMQDSYFYISPSIYNNWSNEKKQIILEDFFFCTERKFLQEYDISIFDSVREAIIENEAIDVKKHELLKIKMLPSRKSFSERFSVFCNMTLKDRQDKIRFTGNEQGNNYPIGPLIIL